MKLYVDFCDWMQEQEAKGSPVEYRMSVEFAKRLRTYLINETDDGESLFLYDHLKITEPAIIPSFIVHHLKDYLHGAST